MLYVSHILTIRQAREKKLVFKLLQIPKRFFSIFIFKNMCINGPMQFKPELFKGQLYMDTLERIIIQK